MKNIAIVNSELIGTIPNLSERALMLTISNNGLVEDIGDYFSEKLKDVSNLLKINTSRVDEIDKKDFNKHTKRLLAQKKDIASIKEKVKYSDVAKVKVPFMVGLNQNIPDAIISLQPAVKIIMENLVDRVNECDTLTAKMLADKDFRKSTKPFKIDRNIHSELSALKEAMSKVMDPEGVLDRDSIEKLLPNLSSLDNIVDQLAKLSDGNTIKHLDSVQKVTKNTSKRVDALFKELKENNDIEVDRERVMVLASLLETTAEYVTTSISILQIVNQLTNTTTIVIERLKDNI